MFAMFVSKLRRVGRGSVGGISCVSSVSSAGPLASLSSSFLRIFLAIGEPVANGRVFPDRDWCV